MIFWCEVNNGKGTRDSAIGKCEPSAFHGHLNMIVAREVARVELVLTNVWMIRWDSGDMNDQKMITYWWTRVVVKVYSMYDFAGELTVIPVNVWWLKRLGRDCRQVNEQHWRVIWTASVSKIWVRWMLGKRIELKSQTPLQLWRTKIHSFSILSDDRSKASSKTIPSHSAI